jgi:hypothetical protein
MAKVDIRRGQAAAKRRICQDLKRVGLTKLALSEKIGFHYNTVKRYLNPDIQGWSPALIDATKKVISEMETSVPCG